LPTYKERRGHPVIFDIKYASEILALSEGSEGLREVIRKHQDDIHEVPVNTDSIIRDIDYWEDYIRETNILDSQ
jgi:molybdenum cofactor cytidylyltransferase